MKQTKLKQIRKFAGLTQEEVVSKFNETHKLSKDRYGRIEKGAVDLKLKDAVVFAGMFKIPVEELNDY